MIGYPYSYNNEEILRQDEIFMIFSLDPIEENSELLTQVSAVPIVLETIQLKGFGDEFTFKFCDKISEICGTFQIIPDTETLVLDYDGFCQLVSKSDIIIDQIAADLLISKGRAIEHAQAFFNQKTVIVQAEGAHGVFYSVGSYFQSAGSAALTAKTLALAKLAGVRGLQILKYQPMLSVTIPFSGAIFFYGCGAIVGESSFGKALVTTGDILALPMKGVEIMWNSYGNPVIQKIFGIPFILNMTQTLKTGPGYTLEEIRQYIPLNRTSIVKTIKEKIIGWLS